MRKAMPNFMKKCFSRRCRPGIPGAILFFVLFSLQMGSCVDVDNTFGTEYIPDNQIMRVLRDSSFRINTYNVTTTDSVVSDGMTYNYIGGYHDPLTGAAVDAGLIFQIQKPLFSNDSLFRTRPVVDSAFLRFYVADWLGKTEVEQTFDLYELTEPVYQDSVYYANFDPTSILESAPLLSFTVSGKENIAYDLMGHPLLDRLMDTTGYTTDDLFRERFKGFYIKPRQTMADASLGRIYLPASGITIHYRYYVEKGDSMSTAQSAYYEVYPPYTTTSSSSSTGFVTIPSVNQSINVVTHDFSNVKPEVRLNDRTTPPPMTYIQGFGGIKTYLEFTRESIDALKAKVRAAGFTDVAVNKAKLLFHCPARTPEELDNQYGRLGMYLDYSTFYYIPDYNYPYEIENRGDLPYGGYLNRSRFLYEMDITTYVQRLFREGYDANKVYLGPAVGDDMSLTDYTRNLRSFALYGAGSTEPPLLVITYTMIR